MVKNLPEFLEVDLYALEMDGVLHLSDISLPEGVRLAALSHGEDSHDTSIAAIHEPKKAQEPVEVEAAGDSAEDVPVEDGSTDDGEKSED